jgi:hypothetical protein
METPAQTGRRLLAALDDVTHQEAAAIRDGDYASVAPLQALAAELGERLAALAGDPAVAALREQVEAVVGRRRHSQRLLAQRLAAGRLELDRLRNVRQRLARLAPAYGAGGAGGTFNAAA